MYVSCCLLDNSAKPLQLNVAIVMVCPYCIRGVVDVCKGVRFGGFMSSLFLSVLIFLRFFTSGSVSQTSYLNRAKIVDKACLAYVVFFSHLF